MEDTATEQQKPAESGDNLENRLQSQFNEEKWTRISSKDVSISRFKLLEDLLNDARTEHKFETVKELAQEQLEDYEASISARYFLGMIALDRNLPEETIYLKHLLDQFEEASKWAVVEYLSEKMLSVTENRTILRARANALEKLGKGKEAIPVWERLAQIDRKDPEIALKYADAVINDDLDKAVQFYKQATEAFAKNMQFERLKSVWSKLIDLVPDDFQYFRKIERILSGHRQKEILADLYVQLAHHYIKKEDIENIIYLSKKILEYNPNYVRFKNELIKSYREKYKDNSLLEDFLKYSGLMSQKKNISIAIQNFETNIVFDKNNYVFHRTWGVGKITDINTEEMVIDFKDKPGHRMNIQMALKSLKPLKEDHFWVYQFEKPEDLEKLFEEDITRFFKILISSFGGRISLADIKAELADKYVPLKSWSKWWSKTRSAILQDDLIGVSPQKRDVIELYEQPVTASEKSIEKFQADKNTFEDRVSVAIDAIKDTATEEEALEFMEPVFKENLKAIDFSHRLQSMLVLDMIHEDLKNEEKEYSEKFQRQQIEELQKMSVKDVAELGMSFKQLELKKAFASFVREHYEEWQKVFIEMLFETPIKLHKTLISDLVHTESYDDLRSFITRLRRESADNAEVFLWTVKNLISGTWKIPDVGIEEQILGLFRLVRKLPKIESKGTKLKNAARDIIIGSTQKDLLSTIENRATESVRKLASLLRDVSLLSDKERDAVISALKNINPESFADEGEHEEKTINAEEIIKHLKEEHSVVASKSAHENMQQELEHILNVEIPENSEEIGIAQEKGDLRENAEYKAAMEKQTMLQNQVKKLEHDIKNANIFTSENVPSDHVSIGSKVKLKDKKTDDIFVYSVLDQWDADVDKGIISYKSPLGEALIGKKVGETAEFSEQVLEVLSIQKALDAEGYLV